jgi:hypothetical protein
MQWRSGLDAMASGRSFISFVAQTFQTFQTLSSRTLTHLTAVYHRVYALDLCCSAVQCSAVKEKEKWFTQSDRLAIWNTHRTTPKGITSKVLTRRKVWSASSTSGLRSSASGCSLLEVTPDRQTDRQAGIRFCQGKKCMCMHACIRRMGGLA